MAIVKVNVILHDSHGQLVDDMEIKLNDEQCHLLHNLKTDQRQRLFDRIFVDVIGASQEIVERHLEHTKEALKTIEEMKQ